MKILNVFGQLLLYASKKLNNLSKALGTKVIGPVSTTEATQTLLWEVLDGPFRRDEFDLTRFDQDIQEDFNYMLVVLIEEDGKLGPVNFWYETHEDAKAVVDYFKSNIEPLELG